MGMRVAEDVDPYKEESNILMRSTLSGGFLFISEFSAAAIVDACDDPANLHCIIAVEW